MSIRPPQRPLKGQEIPEDWFPQLWDYVRSLELRGDLKTTQVKRDRSGTVVHAYARSGLSLPSMQSMIAVIDVDNGDGSYDATEQRNSAGTFADKASPIAFDSGNNGRLYELNGLRGVPVGSIVVVQRIEDVSSGGPIWYFDGQELAYGVNGSGAWVEITGGTGPYNWKQKQPDSSTDTATPSVTGTGNLYEVNSVANISSGTRVWAVKDGTNYRFQYAGAASSSGGTISGGPAYRIKFASTAAQQYRQMVSGYPLTAGPCAAWGTGGDVMFASASAADGSTWNSEVTAVSSVAHGGVAVCEASGYPLIAYDTVSAGSYYIKCVLGTDAAGSSFGSPVTIDGVDTTKDKLVYRMIPVNGYPAVVYLQYGTFAGDYTLLYCQASAADGSAWNSPVTLVSASLYVSIVDLAVIDGYPAVIYSTGSGTSMQTTYRRATDANGSSWGTAYSVGTTATNSGKAQLTEVESLPGIVICSNNQVTYYRCTTADGSGTWNSKIVVSSLATSGVNHLAILVVGGRPCIFVSGSQYIATNTSGLIASWVNTYIESAPTLAGALSFVHVPAFPISDHPAGIGMESGRYPSYHLAGDAPRFMGGFYP